MKDRIKKYYRDTLTGILMTLSLVITVFLILNFIRLVNSMDENNKDNKYVQEMVLLMDYMEGADGQTNYGSISDMNIVKALEKDIANISCYIGAEIEGTTSYSYKVQYVISHNEKFIEKLKDKKDVEDALKNGNAFVTEYMLQYVTEKNGEQYITVGGEEYKVAGILEEKSIAGNDKDIVIFTDKMSDKQKEKINGRIIGNNLTYIKIGSNKKDLLDLYKTMNSEFNAYNVNLYAVDGISKSSSQWMLESMNSTIQPIVLFFCFVNVYVVTGIWVRRRLKECAIRKAFGATYSKIMFHLVSEMMKCVIVSVVCGVLLQYLYLIVIDKPFVLKHYITQKGLGIILVIWVLIMFVLFSYGKLVKKMEPVNAIRKM